MRGRIVSIEDGVQLDQEGCALVITMSNPGRRNAFYPEMRNRMLDVMRGAAADNSVRAIVLTGADGHFCSGADLTRAVALRDQQPARRGPLAARESLQDVQRLLRVIVAGGRPVIAAVEGDAFGGGMAMA